MRSHVTFRNRLQLNVDQPYLRLVKQWFLCSTTFLHAPFQTTFQGKMFQYLRDSKVRQSKYRMFFVLSECWWQNSSMKGCSWHRLMMPSTHHTTSNPGPERKSSSTDQGWTSQRVWSAKHGPYRHAHQCWWYDPGAAHICDNAWTDYSSTWIMSSSV